MSQQLKRPSLQNFPARCGLILLTGLGAALSAGCQNDEIRAYTVPANKAAVDLSRLSDYRLPKHWVRVTPKEQGFGVLAAFRVSEGDDSADITITRLQGGGGGLFANLHRWRVQSMKLDPLEPEETEKLAQEIKVAGLKGYAVDITGSDKLPAAQRRMLGVMVFGGSASWFFKMQGPVDFVGKQKPAFDEFIQSVRFGTTGASDG